MQRDWVFTGCIWKRGDFALLLIISHVFGRDCVNHHRDVYSKTVMRYLYLLAIPVFLLTGLFSAGCSNSSSMSGRTQGVYAEFGNFNDFSSAIPLLKQTGTQLLLAVYPSDIGSSQLLSILNEASANGVQVRLWPMLDQSNGVWPDEDNVDLFSQEINSLVSWLGDNRVTPGWLIFDMEPPYALTMSMTTAAQSGGVSSVISLLLSYISPSAYSYAFQHFSDVVQSAHQKGWKVECVTYPLVLDDLAAGKQNIQMLFHIPVTGLPWDQVSFMVYQSSFKALLGKYYGPAIVASYSKDAYKFYENNAVVALGVIGTDPISGAQGYTDTTGLFNDIAAALGKGIVHVEIYSLGEILAQPSPRTWLETSGIKPSEPALSSDVQSIRTLIQNLDRGL